MTKHVSFLLPMAVAATILGGCDAVTTGSTERVNRTYEDGHQVTVLVDPSYVSAPMAFQTVEQYHAYLRTLDESGTIRVNARHWSLLQHANDPAEISVLDRDRSVTVGDFAYYVGQEAVFRRKIDDPRSQRELELFYGKSGQEDLIEFVRAAQTQPGADVATGDFRNEFARKLALQLADIYEWPTRPAEPAAYATCYYLGNVESSDTMECFVNAPALLPDGTGEILPPSGYDRAPGHYDVRMLLLYRSYAKGIKKRAYGLTQAAIRRTDSGNAYFGLRESSCPGYEDLVLAGDKSYIERGPLFAVKVDGGSSDATPCVASNVTRRRGGDHSTHDSWVRFREPVDARPGVYSGETIKVLSEKALR